MNNHRTRVVAIRHVRQSVTHPPASARDEPPGDGARTRHTRCSVGGMVAFTRWPTMLFVALLVLGCAGYADAKRPPSAFGEAYDARETTPPRAGDVDDVPDVARERPSKAPRKVKPPRPGKRHKITLDGSTGARGETVESDGGDDF